MDLIPVTEAAETREDQESVRLTQLSVSTLLYMIDHGEALENRLRHHRVELRFFVEETFDLLEGMRLSARLKRVDTNISRAGRTNAGIRAELLHRELRIG